MDKTKLGPTVALAAGIALLICFFLPWLEINALIARISVNGYDLGTGRGGRGLPILLLAPLCALAAILAAATRLRRAAAQPAERTPSVVLVAAGLLSSGAIAYLFVSFSADLNRPTNNPFEQLGQALARQAVTFLAGSYGSLLSSLGVLVGGLIEFSANKNALPQPGATSVQPQAANFISAAQPVLTTPFNPAPAPPPPMPGLIPPQQPPFPAPAPPLVTGRTPFAALGNAAQPQKSCPRCGNLNPGNGRFCTGCGADLAATLRAPAPVPPPTPLFNPALAADPLVGQTIEGKYRLEAKLGAGGMGAVYRATRLLIGDTVAVKILHPEQVADPHAAERFRREAQAAARLKHPNAVSIHDFGITSGGLVYLAMELVEGQSLRQWIAQRGPLAPTAAAEIMNQACAALDEAHRQRIVHRDLKPDNLIVRATNSGLHVKVLDFGIAKLRDLAATASTLTQTGSVMGTPHYMSPEQCLGEELDHRSDIYSLGVVLYEMLAGVVPFNSPTSTAVVVQHVSQPPPSLRAINVSISPTVEAVVLRALEKQRDARPQTAGLLAQALTAAVTGTVPITPAMVSGIASINPTPSFGPAAGPTSGPNSGQNSGMMPTMMMQAAASGRVTPHTATPFVSASTPPFAQSQPETTVSTFQRYRTAIIAGGAVAAVALLLIVYLVFFSAKRSILSEVRRGNLVKPEGSSAYDTYLKNKNSFSAADRSEIEREAAPALEQRGNEIMTRLKQEANESEAEWAESTRLYEWLNDLRAQPAYQSRQFFSQARLAFLKKDYGRSIADYQRAIQLDASWALPFNGLGRSYVQMKDKATGSNYYRRATEIEPNWIYPWLNLSGVSLELNDPYTGETAARQALSLDASKASAHHLLGQSLEKQGRGCEAVQAYQAALNNAYNAPSPPFNVDALRTRTERLQRQYFCFAQ
jgi:serine/threonine protein kinase